MLLITHKSLINNQSFIQWHMCLLIHDDYIFEYYQFFTGFCGQVGIFCKQSGTQAPSENAIVVVVPVIETRIVVVNRVMVEVVIG